MVKITKKGDANHCMGSPRVPEKKIYDVISNAGRGDDSNIEGKVVKGREGGKYLFI